MSLKFDFVKTKIPKNPSIKLQALYSKLPPKSTFDLPVEYHQDAIAEHFSLNASIPFSKVIEQKGQKRKSRFKYLDPKILLNQLESRPSYALFRRMALEKLEYDVLTALGVFKMIHRCRQQDVDGFDIPHRMFGWAMDDFLQRRQQNNVIWIDVLLRDYSLPCLYKAKLFMDIEELERYMRLIFEGLQHEEESFDLETDVLDYLTDAYDSVDIYNHVRAQKLRHLSIISTETNKSLNLQVHANEIKAGHRKVELEEKLMSCHVLYPAEKRYQLNFHKAQIDQCEMQHRNQELVYENQIAKYHERIKMEAHVCQRAVDAYFVEIEQFQTRINDLTLKCDKEVEKMENEIAYKRLSLDKLKEHRKFLTEQMERFHEEIEHMRLREERLRQRELLRIEMEYKALLLKSLKKKKGKGKGRKSKK